LNRFIEGVELVLGLFVSNDGTAGLQFVVALKILLALISLVVCFSVM